uniref:ORF44 n=1 Tax=Human herpesvirus 3 TaxID=10335 RepID=A0A075X2P5_HHV3|nr:ORF44 [Human alphaherpesvirus 3]ANS13507.1 ORF44 [Human alphaherpesvirus 3]ANS13581.1 ORF44 [Human alphaherpesvirus 3]AVY51210.1 ORF44 [Human alphaherpesvirus 3]QWE79399.1 ORF44 [Human alphaherpesvirus 3]
MELQRIFPLYTATGAARKLTPEAVQKLCDALTLDMGLWKSILTDPRVKIMRSTAFITLRIAPFIPLQTDTTNIAVVVATIYITRPRQMNLPPKTFHVIVNFNYEVSYAMTATLRIYPVENIDHVFGATFKNPIAYPLPTSIPDPRADPTPADLTPTPNLSDYLQPPRLPKNPYACKVISPGVWWSDERRRLYVLAMEPNLIGLCPAGWHARILGSVLNRLLSHADGCDECNHRVHVGALYALPHVTNHAEGCVCWAPCMWRKAGQRELKVEVDIGATQVLFVDVTTCIRITSTKNPRITANLGDVIAGTNASGLSVPVNSSGWQLYMFGETLSRAIINGCGLLQRICFPETQRLSGEPEPTTT